MPQIEVQDLCKTYKVPVREGGLRAALGSLIHRRYRRVRAVDNVSFTIGEGEIVGFLGPNGAGKTTTLKILSGLLHPDSGRATVLGCTPWHRQPGYLRRISMVMGQRSQLNWDLPAADSFLVQLAVYRVDLHEGPAMRDKLVDLLDLRGVLHKPVRTLSLGERMKCEICVSLLHRPQVLFLDEPTLGVDVTMQARIREFIAEYNRQWGATIILTSHYMADVAALCRRVVVMDHGRLLFDGPLAELSRRTAPFKTIAIHLHRTIDGYDFARMGDVVGREDRTVRLQVPKDEAPAVASRLLADLPIQDLTIEDPPIEDVIRRVFANSAQQDR